MTVTSSTKATIASGGSLRLYMWVPGFELTQAKYTNSVTFKYEDEYNGLYDICTVPFYYTDDSQYNPDGND